MSLHGQGGQWGKALPGGGPLHRTAEIVEPVEPAYGIPRARLAPWQTYENIAVLIGFGRLLSWTFWDLVILVEVSYI